MLSNISFGPHQSKIREKNYILTLQQHFKNDIKIKKKEKLQ